MGQNNYSCRLEGLRCHGHEDGGSGFGLGSGVVVDARRGPGP